MTVDIRKEHEWQIRLRQSPLFTNQAYSPSDLHVEGASINISKFPCIVVSNHWFSRLCHFLLLTSCTWKDMTYFFLLHKLAVKHQYNYSSQTGHPTSMNINISIINSTVLHRVPSLADSSSLQLSSRARLERTSPLLRRLFIHQFHLSTAYYSLYNLISVCCHSLLLHWHGSGRFSAPFHWRGWELYEPINQICLNFSSRSGLIKLNSFFPVEVIPSSICKFMINYMVSSDILVI